MSDLRPMLMSSYTQTPEQTRTLLDLGFTLFQTDSDHLSTNEVAPGTWDWTAYDAAQQQVTAFGARWMFFPHFAFPPEWYRRDREFVRLRCLEHDEPVEAFSIWDPRALEFLEAGWREIAAHYSGPRRPVDAFYLGVHGDYGETMYPAACRLGNSDQKDDWEKRFGNLHNHYGYWCGDSLARADFRRQLLARYGSLAALNAAWGTAFTVPDDVTYPTGPDSRRWWLDFTRWYVDSLTTYSRQVAQAAARNCPSALRMFPVGAGDEDPRIGQDYSALAKMAAEEGTIIRSTHGGCRPFAQNAATQLVRLATACRFYGAPFWSEPPGAITAAGEVSRIFESICCGAQGFWDWHTNPIAPEAQAVFRQYRHLLVIDPPVVEVAVLFPQTDHWLHRDQGMPNKYFELAPRLRDFVHFEILDENLIRDGALDRYRFLVHLDGTVFERATLERISAWVERGGVFCSFTDTPVETVEGARDVAAHLFAVAPTPCTPERVGDGAVVRMFGGAAEAEAYFKLLSEVFYRTPPAQDTRPVTSIDTEPDGIYGVVLASGRRLLHNPSAEIKHKRVGDITYTLLPASIVEVATPGTAGTGA